MIYKNILARCKEKGINISALEKAVGLGNATIKGWEKSSPRVDKLQLVADFFGCTLDELVNEREG